MNVKVPLQFKTLKVNFFFVCKPLILLQEVCHRSTANSDSTHSIPQTFIRCCEKPCFISAPQVLEIECCWYIWWKQWSNVRLQPSSSLTSAHSSSGLCCSAAPYTAKQFTGGWESHRPPWKKGEKKKGVFSLLLLEDRDREANEGRDHGNHNHDVCRVRISHNIGSSSSELPQKTNTHYRICIFNAESWHPSHPLPWGSFLFVLSLHNS